MSILPTKCLRTKQWEILFTEVENEMCQDILQFLMLHKIVFCYFASLKFENTFKTLKTSSKIT